MISLTSPALDEIFVVGGDNPLKERSMVKVKINIQDQFLNNVRREKADVTIKLENGEEMNGVLKAFDNFCMVLKSGENYHLIYKHAVSFVRPSYPLKKFDAIYENF
jgi:host factor-I protein